MRRDSGINRNGARFGSRLAIASCSLLVLLDCAKAEEMTPRWLPEGYSVTEVSRSVDGGFSAYSLNAKNVSGIYVLDRETRLTTLIAPPDGEVVDGVLKRDFQLDHARLKETRVVSLNWKKDDLLEVVYAVQTWGNDPRFRRNDLKLTRVFQCSYGPRVSEVGSPKGGLIPMLGY